MSWKKHFTEYQTTSNNETSNCKFIAIKEKNRLLDPENILIELANIGITSDRA